jgi:fatty acid desaturase
MRKRFLIWWLEAFGYVPKLRELIAIACLFFGVGIFLWLVTKNVILVVVLITLLAVITFYVVTAYASPWDGIEEDFMQDNIEQERRRLEAEYEN